MQEERDAAQAKEETERMKELEQLLHDLDDTLSQPVEDIVPIVESVMQSVASKIHAIRGSHDMKIIAEELCQSKLFTDEGDQFAKILAKQDIEKLDADKGYVVVSLLFHVGQLSPNVYRRLAEDDWFTKLRDVVLSRAWASAVFNKGDRMHHAAARLLYEVCRVQELSISEMELLNDELIQSICDTIERTRDDHREEFNYDLIRLLLIFNDQFTKKNARTLVMINRVLSSVGSRISHSKTLTENLVFMFNRADDMPTQILLIEFLKVLFEDSTTWDIIYTNDLRIVLDVIVRETRNVEDELQYMYINMLPPLLLNTNLGELNYKKEETSKLLHELIHDRFGHVSLRVRKAAEKVLADTEAILNH
ncbi:hypothetical protein SmJEL517_g05278 [Synchytrium microbalum]|uniref:SPIN90/Ldb17 leucine-rich domain-containing protein n=1 Tax=Synchytrium microbalum TaxID=1806994 RepID=A0A507BZY7_9FUNG|nr:uncharacterized protein SmJEL517_g05278 [Synchytrium microbalum]TPX31364.1 hypothetical protein SmJEL517_g05278 [Synchytrium microbalum]